MVLIHSTSTMRINGRVLSEGEERNYLITKIFNIEYEYPEKSLFNLFNKSKQEGFSVKLEVCPNVNDTNLVSNGISCKEILENYFPTILVAFYNETNYGLMQYFIHYCAPDTILKWWNTVNKYMESYRLFDMMSSSSICGEKFRRIIGNDTDAISMSGMGFAD